MPNGMYSINAAYHGKEYATWDWAGFNEWSKSGLFKARWDGIDSNQVRVVNEGMAILPRVKN